MSFRSLKSTLIKDTESEAVKSRSFGILNSWPHYSPSSLAVVRPSHTLVVTPVQKIRTT